MTEKIMILDQITILPETGAVMCRFQPSTVYDDGEVNKHPPHRMLPLMPGMDVDQHVAAINEHFAAGVTDAEMVTRTYAPIRVQDVTTIKSVMKLFHTPDVAEKHRLRRIAEEKRFGTVG